MRTISAPKVATELLKIFSQKVNAVAKFDVYPMLRVDELIENIGQAGYISTLDLTKGYWKVPVAPEDQEKTVFTTPWGLFHFRRMPFGLHGAVATFQRLVDRVLAPHMVASASLLLGKRHDHLNLLFAVRALQVH
ncbi:hypothetical protein Y1Q_0021418 [Alligator mississippiensis]|uniref:ribonuclease H n=1 Tax=Alligator mississippiensis TaxID=8496 RepID=A0A151PA22_ALLMI|nr:hypothetical protein Y1Q_0021418 [Alligator mississippiensis]